MSSAGRGGSYKWTVLVNTTIAAAGEVPRAGQDAAGPLTRRRAMILKEDA